MAGEGDAWLLLQDGPASLSLRQKLDVRLQETEVPLLTAWVGGRETQAQDASPPLSQSSEMLICLTRRSMNP